MQRSLTPPLRTSSPPQRQAKLSAQGQHGEGELHRQVCRHRARRRRRRVWYAKRGRSKALKLIRLADSTYDKKKRSHTPLVVKAGVGKLIAGWDAALLTMSVGEEAVLQIPAEHAYGKTGKKDPSGKVIIPANQDLVFTVTLVNVMD